MEPFRYLPHTADAKFRAFGKKFPDALKNAGCAVINLIADVTKILPRKKHSFSVTADSRENLTVDFLQELIFLLETKEFLMCDAQLKIDKIAPDKFMLKAQVSGDVIKNYKTHGHVKAITYHDLKVAEDKNGVMIQVVVDV